jgi:NAD(P)-dependent dehydrogenase (short-subunit alcohol dehydrogenase family)
MDQDWTTQNIVVTGAASGLGRAICYRFAQLGARVHGVDLNDAALVELRHSLGPEFSAVTCDISEWAQVTTAFERFKVIDVLVNTGRNSNPDGRGNADRAGEIYDDQNSHGSLRIPG